MDQKQPFFSIVTVAYKDCWALTKTARSLFRQQYEDFEYLIIDGASYDGTSSLIRFWEGAGLVDKALVESDNGVYDAMNKGLALAEGQYVCFMNAGDVFAHDRVLLRAFDYLTRENCDGCLGWGELGGRIWASWRESAAFRLSSLGFCHQALFVKRERLLNMLFDSRPQKTDSDTFQLAALYDAGAQISIIPEVWAIRGGEPGISANLDRTKNSIRETITDSYPSVDKEMAENIIEFRRTGGKREEIEELLSSAQPVLQDHLASMVLDTLFQPASRSLDSAVANELFKKSVSALGVSIGPKAASAEVRRLVSSQSMRKEKMAAAAQKKAELSAKITEYRSQEERRYNRIGAQNKVSVADITDDYVVALTSFPARLPAVDLVIKSLATQTAPPKKILLILGRDEIPNRNWLPKRLLDFESVGLEIIFADRTCHQYDKYLHTWRYNNDKPYIIVDDDVIYPDRSMELLLNAHRKFPNAIIGNRCHLMDVDPAGKLGPYRDWIREQRKDAPAFDLMPTGAGGVLYPAGFFADKQTTSIDLIMEHAPYADDIWLKFCALAQHRPTYATEFSSGSKWYLRYTPTMREGTLMDVNVDRGLNDMQIAKAEAWLSSVYPDWRADLATASNMEFAQ